MRNILVKSKPLMAAALAVAVLGAQSPAANAQAPASLPNIDQVEQLGPLPIDGVWKIREIGERVVIRDGHAFADDGWVHMFIFRILPRQVVISEIRELADGGFIARDLPLLTTVEFQWVGPNTLRGQTKGLIPITYHLYRVDGAGGEYPDDPPPYDGDGDDWPIDDDPPADDEEYVEPW